jgi:hypothetical protein
MIYNECIRSRALIRYKNKIEVENMLKIKVSKSTIKSNYNYIMGVGYCKMQYMLMYEKAWYYSTGVYGWSCDHYIINLNNEESLVISTGYAPIKNINLSYDPVMLSKYENKARDIYDNYDLTHEEKKHMIRKVFDKYINTFLYL